MKKIERALLGAAALLFLSTEIFAAKAKAPKDVWVAKEKNGTLLTTDSSGWVYLDLKDEIDVSGYKYFQIEISSPDEKKFDHIFVSLQFSPEENDEYDWDTCGRANFYGVSKKSAAFQGVIFSGNKCYDHWQDGKLVVRKPEAQVVSGLSISAKQSDYSEVAGVKVYVKKITVTNEALGQTYKVDLAKKRFVTLNSKSVWEHDNSVHYYGHVNLKSFVPATLKKGDVVQVKIKGTNAYDLGNISLRIKDSSSDPWKDVSFPAYLEGLKKDQAVDETFDFIIERDAGGALLELCSYEEKFTGPYIIVAE
ncbi:MAG: hypothetical protein IK094_06290 [Treponema sp.]|nr:hypothetical protein [Treponema sp.]